MVLNIKQKAERTAMERVAFEWTRMIRNVDGIWCNGEKRTDKKVAPTIQTTAWFGFLACAFFSYFQSHRI